MVQYNLWSPRSGTMYNCIYSPIDKSTLEYSCSTVFQYSSIFERSGQQQSTAVTKSSQILIAADASKDLSLPALPALLWCSLKHGS